MKDMDDRVLRALSGIGEDLIAEAAVTQPPAPSRRSYVAHTIGRYTAIAAACAMLFFGGMIGWRYLNGMAPSEIEPPSPGLEQAGVQTVHGYVSAAPFEPKRVIHINVLENPEEHLEYIAPLELDKLSAYSGLRLDLAEVIEDITTISSLVNEEDINRIRYNSKSSLIRKIDITMYGDKLASVMIYPNLKISSINGVDMILQQFYVNQGIAISYSPIGYSAQFDYNDTRIDVNSVELSEEEFIAVLDYMTRK